MSQNVIQIVEILYYAYIYIYFLSDHPIFYCIGNLHYLRQKNKI